MDTDLKAEILAQAERLDELIDKSTDIIVKTNALLDQSRRLIRRAQPHGLGRPKPQPRHGVPNAIVSNH
jgi:hypothetical protein